MVQNKAVIFKKIPDGFPVPGQDLVVETRDFDLNAAPPQGGITTQNFYASFDPYQRGKMRPSHIKSYSQAFELNEPLANSTIAKVLKSDTDRFQSGDLIHGGLPTEEYSRVSAETLKSPAFRKLPTTYQNIHPQTFIGALGMPGLTAYSSLHEIGEPKKGETIFISAASGAVGAVVGQIAKQEGLKVIGSVGSDQKLEYITKTLGFDGGFNYKKEKPLEALRRLAPNGIDIYYENVGGEQLEAAIEVLNQFGRIVACGMISQYNVKSGEGYHVRNLTNIIGKRLKVQGFIVGDANMGPKWVKEHQEKVGKWISEGVYKPQEDVTEGIDNGPAAFVGMLQGKNFGKTVLKIADHQENVRSAL